MASSLIKPSAAIAAMNLPAEKEVTLNNYMTLKTGT